jgi:hypothetical protein
VPATTCAPRLWEEQKLRVDRRKLQMETIKRVGRYTVPFEIFADVVAELRLAVAPEGQELPSEEELAALEAAEQAEAAATAEVAEAAPPEAAAEPATAAVEAEPGPAEPEPAEPEE